MKRLTSILLAVLFALGTLTLLATSVFAASYQSTNSNYFSFSDIKSCEDGSGYTNPKELSSGDPLALTENFVKIKVKNYSSTVYKDGIRYFLKTSPDVPSLSIEVLDDIKNIADTGAKICTDGTMAGVPEYKYPGAVGDGMLFIEYTSFQGDKKIYSIGDAFELDENIDSAIFGKEGTYKISLMFETVRQIGTHKEWHNPFYFTNEPTYEYRNYRLDTGSFVIANGNCMIFAFDKNGNEIYNGAVVDSFTLDYANSQFLQVEIKREVFVGESDFTDSNDVRFNSVGVDKRTYSDDGIYTVTVRNQITGASTVKRFLVTNAKPSNAIKAVNAAAEKYPNDFEPINSQNEIYVTQPDIINQPVGGTKTVLAVFCIVLALVGTAVVTFIVVKRSS